MQKRNFIEELEQNFFKVPEVFAETLENQINSTGTARTFGTKVINYNLEVQKEMRKDVVENIRCDVNGAENLAEIDFKKLIKDFLDTYKMTLFENDNKDHALDLQNAVTIINSMGDNLDYDTLYKLLEPLKNAEREFTILRKLVDSKDRIDTDTKKAFDSILGINTTESDLINVYMEKYSIVENALDTRKPVTYSIQEVDNNGTYKVSVNHSYDCLCMKDWYNDVIKVYNSISKSRGIVE